MVAACYPGGPWTRRISCGVVDSVSDHRKSMGVVSEAKASCGGAAKGTGFSEPMPVVCRTGKLDRFHHQEGRLSSHVVGRSLVTIGRQCSFGAAGDPKCWATIPGIWDQDLTFQMKNSPFGCIGTAFLHERHVGGGLPRLVAVDIMGAGSEARLRVSVITPGAAKFSKPAESAGDHAAEIPFRRVHISCVCRSAESK